MNKSEIHWEQVSKKVSEIKKQKSKRFEHIKNEIEDSNLDFLDGADLDYYAAELTYNDLSKKKWKIPDVIELNQKKNPHKTNFDYINCFVNSDSDDIIDFF